MDITPVDPRDQTWELERPTYRVYFWDVNGGSDEYELSGGDIEAVLEWAERERSQRTFALYVCIPNDGLGLVRLAGHDPNAASPQS